MKWVQVFFFTILLYGGFSMVAFSDELPESVKVYFVPWEMEFRKMPSQRDIRDESFVTFTINNSWYAEGFRQWLRLGEFKRTEGGERPVNARLVIDIKTSSKTETFVSDGEYLYDSSGAYSRKIDKEFRETFNINHGGLDGFDMPYSIKK